MPEFQDLNAQEQNGITSSFSQAAFQWERQTLAAWMDPSLPVSQGGGEAKAGSVKSMLHKRTDTVFC